MRTEQDIRALIIAAANQRMAERKAPAYDFQDTTTIFETGMDSLDMVELWLELEETLGWNLPEDEIKAARTFGDLVAMCIKSQPEPAQPKTTE